MSAFTEVRARLEGYITELQDAILEVDRVEAIYKRLASTHDALNLSEFATATIERKHEGKRPRKKLPKLPHFDRSPLNPKETWAKAIRAVLEQAEEALTVSGIVERLKERGRHFSPKMRPDAVVRATLHRCKGAEGWEQVEISGAANRWRLRPNVGGKTEHGEGRTQAEATK